MEELNIQPPKDLLEKVLKRVHKEQRFFFFKRIAIISTTLIISIIALIPSLNMVISDLNQSGFNSFISLLFSDFSTVIVYWKSFTIILLETIPALSLALFLTVLLTLLQSIKSLTKNIKTISGINHLLTSR